MWGPLTLAKVTEIVSAGRKEEASYSSVLMALRHLVQGIGVHTHAVGNEALRTLKGQDHRPIVKVTPRWYY